MRKTIFEYLEFALSAYNCVIIPDFGGFIMNVSPAVLSINGEIKPPKQSIVFNPILKHDDGILASYIAKDEEVSYNAALKKIKEVVSNLKNDLKSGKTIECAKLGVLRTENENIAFIAKADAIYPSLFGLYPTRIQQLGMIDQSVTKEKRSISLRYAATGIAAAIAALMMFIAPGGSIKDPNNVNTQKADFMSSITATLSSRESIIEPTTQPEEKTVGEETIIEKKAISTRTYYIIIGGEDSPARAKQLLNKMKESGFADARILETSDRYRIYISSFDDKSEAESFLTSFRKENPKYETAWLFSKRNH